MNIKKVWTVWYSATGNTDRVVHRAAKAAAAALNVPLESVRFSTPEEREREYSFASEDLVLVAVPTYAGKMPNKLLPDFQSRLHGNGALAGAVVTFGNRNYDHSLAELCQTLENDGFHTVAGGAFAGQHAFATLLAEGRPDEQDLQVAEAFGRKLAERVLSLTEVPEPIQVKGNAAAPYYIPRGLDGAPAKFLKAKPKTDAVACIDCGVCVKVCPMGAIDPKNVCSVPGICMKCQACVRQCPTGAKYFDDPAFLSHKAMLEQTYLGRKDNEIFF